MNRKDYSPLFADWRTLEPEEFIEQLYIKTDLDGVLNLAEWQIVDMEHTVPGVNRHHMNWTVVDKDRILRQFRTLYTSLQKIAPHFDMKATAAPAALKDAQLLEVWEKYVRPLDGGNMDLQKVKDIADRINTQQAVQNIAGYFSKGKELDAYEKDLLIEYMDVTVSAEERAYLNQYEENLHKDAQQRVGGKCWARFLIEQVRWLCRTIRRNPPEHILRTQLIQLAYYFAINAACESMEVLKNTEYLWKEMLAMESDDDYEAEDAAEAGKKTNSVKSLVPVFVVQILKEKTNPMTHMRQTELLEALKQYEIFIERKALNRTVHTLADSSLPIRQDKSGVWYEQ